MRLLQAMPEPLLVGLSGGADSVALLRLLLDAQKQVTAVHVNHGLRGADSDGDEQFVRELCAALKVPLLVYRAAPPSNPGEGWAREVRYGFYRQAARATGIDTIALAHHRDDQAETLLLHLLRGAGLTGLAAMQPDTMAEGLRILRPLLGCSREELKEYLASCGQAWREDRSNQDPAYLRNALRLEVLPLLERLAPGVSGRLAAAAEILREDEAVLTGLTEAFMADHGCEKHILMHTLACQPEGLQKRILRAWWLRHAPPGKEHGLSSGQTRALQNLICAPAGSRCNLPAGWYGQAGWTHLHLISPEETAGMAEGPLECCGLFHLEACHGRTGNGREVQVIPQALVREAVVRTRRAGDWIRPYGGKGRQSLQDYFTNRRIDAPFRDRVPLICIGSEVLLAGGAGAGALPDVKDIKDPVLLVWNTTFPWLQS